MKLRIGYLLSGITTGFIMLLSFVWTQPDGKLHIVFCDVGQGDAAYVQLADGRDMLIDSGPNDRVLSCLGRHMPFWDRHIDIVVLSHPEKDHMGGLVSVFSRYTVGYFVRSQVDASSEGFQKLMDVVNTKHINVRYMTTGDTITIGSTSLLAFWPGKEEIATHVNQKASGLASLKLNDFSLVLALRYGTIDVLFTGDADSRVEARYIQLQAFNDPVEILKVPHHGSKTGMTQAFVDWVKPAIAVISVGKNTYGHPSDEAINMLTLQGARVFRTDIRGDIEVISDGDTFSIK